MHERLVLGVLALGVLAGTADPAAAGSRLAGPRSLHTATVLADGRVMLVGGFRDRPFGTMDRVELYDPVKRTWRRGPRLTHARKQHTATLLADGRVLVVGGGTFDAAAGLWSEPPPEIWSPATNKWTAAAPVATAAMDHTATLLADGRVIVVGGIFGDGTSLPEAQVYDPASDTWTPAGTPVVPRILHTAVALPGGGVALFGGVTGTGPDAVDAVDVWDPRTSTWTTLMRLATARSGATTTPLPDGRVLVVGGSDSAGFLASAEVCDVASGHCASAGSMTIARSDHVAVALASGDIVIVGGETGALARPDQVAELEIFDPKTFKWRTGTALATARHEHTATVLPDGKILVAGGAGCGVACERTIASYERVVP